MSTGSAPGTPTCMSAAHGSLGLVSYWSEIVGQPEAVRLLDRAASADGTPAHAWLITGPPGSGRSNLALRFAAALIARSADEREHVYDQVRAGTHPDAAVLATERVIITIEEVRGLIPTAYYAPSIGRYRVLVVEDADRMNEYASNVLLKALEEPPERTIWVLCAPSEADLLPTIRSRARLLRLSTPSVDDVASLLRDRDGLDPVLAERAARLTQQHIGMARRLATDAGALERREQTIAAALSVDTLGEAMRVAGDLVKVAQADADALTEQVDAREREDAMRNLGLVPGEAIPPKMRSQIKHLEEDQKRRARRSLGDGIDRVLTDLLSLYRDVLFVALGVEADLVNGEHRASIEELAERWKTERALAAVSTVERARERLMRSITPGLVLEAMFARIATGDDV